MKNKLIVKKTVIFLLKIKDYFANFPLVNPYNIEGQEN